MRYSAKGFSVSYFLSVFVADYAEIIPCRESFSLQGEKYV